MDDAVEQAVQTPTRHSFLGFSKISVSDCRCEPSVKKTAASLSVEEASGEGPGGIFSDPSLRPDRFSQNWMKQ